MRLTALPLSIALLLCGCAAGPGTPAAVTTEQAMPTEEDRAAATAKLEAEITGFLAEYAEAYNRQDYARLLSLWDREDPDVFYMAEEIDPPMHGWKMIDAYFARPGVLDGIRNEYTAVRASLLAPDLAIATYRLRFDIKVKGMKPLAGFDRVVAVFRRRDGRWRLARYAEAPQAPLTMVRKLAKSSKSLSPEEQKALLKTIQSLQEDAVPADFAEWLSNQERTGGK